MGRFHLLFLFFVALMFAVSLNSLFFYHCYLVVHNRSTLGNFPNIFVSMMYSAVVDWNMWLIDNMFTEAFRTPMFRTGKDKDGFSLGKYNNFQEVFGDNARLWFLPVFSRYVCCFVIFNALCMTKLYDLYTKWEPFAQYTVNNKLFYRYICMLLVYRLS